jgi:5'-nucleotidase
MDENDLYIGTPASGGSHSMEMIDKKVVYVDMDFVLCDYDKGFRLHKGKYPDIKYPQSQPGLYVNLAPIDGAIEAYHWLNEQEELAVYILTAPSLKNPHCYSEKRQWVENHLGFGAVERLIISPNKGLNKGHYLIDDNIKGKGQEDFKGKLIHFGSEAFPDWSSIRDFFEREI